MRRIARKIWKGLPIALVLIAFTAVVVVVSIALFAAWEQWPIVGWTIVSAATLVGLAYVLGDTIATD